MAHKSNRIPKIQAIIGVDSCTKHVNINDHIVRVQIWDTAYMERSVTKSIFRGTDCCVLVYDVSSVKTFTNLEKRHTEILKQINPKDTARFPFVVIGNKADLAQCNVSAESVRNWCQLNNNIPHFEVSAYDGRCAEDAFKIAAKLALDYAEEQVPIVADSSSVSETEI